MTIPLNKAFEILQDASAVIIDGDVLVCPSLDTLTGDDDNEFMYLGWQSEEGLCYSVKYAEELNREVKVSGSSMFLINTDGDEDQITILTPAKLD